MLTHPTLTQLDALGFAGMATAFKELSNNPEAKALDHAEWLGLLLDREITTRKDKRLKSRLRAARLRFGQACIEDIDLSPARGLDKRLWGELTGCGWIRQHHTLIITGACGTGNVPQNRAPPRNPKPHRKRASAATFSPASMRPTAASLKSRS